MHDVRLNLYYQSNNQINDLKGTITDVSPCPGKETSNLPQVVCSKNVQQWNHLGHETNY